ncbi:ATP-grasp domain-containing protein [Streptomyces sp. NPDC002785]|uniref:ATP-grasp domain-containing protein n=1 Tax=Streptomyces sp. NPDC002785 TaxID=3154543 RepID=UPI003328B6B1
MPVNDSPAVLLLDPVRTGAHYKTEAHRRGFTTVSVYTVAKDVIAENWPDHADGDDISIYSADADEILARLDTLGVNLIGVVPAMDSAVHLADTLADRMSLPGNGIARASARRNKADMRRVAVEAGLRIPRFVLVDSTAKIAAAASEIGFPAIAKHTTGAGSYGTYLLSTPEDAAQTSTMHAKNQFGWQVDEWLVEQYIRGRELAVNCFSHDGEHRIVDIWEYRQPDDSDYDFPYWESAKLPEDDPDWQAAADYVREALTAFEVRLGPSHTEVKIGPDGVHLMEVGARLPGGPMTDQWLAHTDLNPFEQALDCYLGVRPACLAAPVHFRQSCGASAIRNDGPPGILKEIRGLDEVRNMPGVDKVLSIYEPGDYVPVTDNTLNIPIGVWVSAPDYPGVVELLGRVRDTLELAIEPAGG